MNILPVKITQYNNIRKPSFRGNTDKKNTDNEIRNEGKSPVTEIPQRSVYENNGYEYFPKAPLQYSSFYHTAPKEYDGKLNADCFFIRMKHYGANSVWAGEMAELAKEISQYIQNKTDFSTVIKIIENETKEINHNGFYGEKRRPGSYYSSTPFLLTKRTRGEEYNEKYDQKLSRGSIHPTDKGMFKEKVNCSHIEKIEVTDCYLIYYPPAQNDDTSNLKIVEKIYNDLINKENPTKNEVVEAAAKIQWLIAQETPYIRGSDSIANLLTKSIMNAYNLPISPLKKGIGLDFEAFGLDLDKYIKNYPDYFEINPLSEKEA